MTEMTDYSLKTTTVSSQFSQKQEHVGVKTTFPIIYAKKKREFMPNNSLTNSRTYSAPEIHDGEGEETPAASLFNSGWGEAGVLGGFLDLFIGFYTKLAPVMVLFLEDLNLNAFSKQNSA